MKPADASSATPVPPASVFLICVGSELLRGKVNLHTSTLARRLAPIGLTLAGEWTVGDDLQALTGAIREAVQRHAVVIVTGGLGPTFDDITREAAARALGRVLTPSPALQAEIRAKFRRARYRMPPANARQAQLVTGATPIPNVVGTAPGQWIHVEDLLHPRRLVLLPGPPAEMQPMLDHFVLPRLRRIFPAGRRTEAHLHFAGLPESRVDQQVRPIIDRQGRVPGLSVQFTILAHQGLVDFDVFVTADRRARGRVRGVLERIIADVRARLGTSLYGINEEYPLEKVAGDRLRRRRATLAVAESCTGGLLSGRLTDVPGSSAYLAGGVVAYNNAAKEELLGVSPALLARHGAVSRPVAAAMARAVRARFGATWGLSITGIAGPGGGTPAKPVGLVFIGLASAAGARVRRFLFRGTREAVRQRSVTAALDLLRRL